MSSPKLQIPSSNALPSPNCQTASEIRFGVNYVGLLDEVSVFPRVLTQAQVQAHYLASGRSATWSTPPGDAYAAQVTGDGPDLYWRLNETSGSTAVDSSTSGQDGTFVTGTSFTSTASPASVPARAVSFNGSSGPFAGTNDLSSLQGPLVSFIERTVGPRDLFGFLTPRNSVKDLVLVARSSETIRVMPPFEPPPESYFLVETPEGIPLQVVPSEGWSSFDVLQGVVQGTVKLLLGSEVLWRRPLGAPPTEPR